MLFKKIRQVENIFKSIDKSISRLKHVSGMECVPFCIECCKNPDIETTVLEFLPLAYHLYKIDKFDEILDKINNSPDNLICVLLNPDLFKERIGGCSEYPYRGLICRTFGFSIRENKNNIPELVTCKYIKNKNLEEYQSALTYISRYKRIPLLRKYALKFLNIDVDMANRYYPINTAIKLAIEKVCFYYQNRYNNRVV